MNMCREIGRKGIVYVRINSTSVTQSRIAHSSKCMYENIEDTMTVVCISVPNISISPARRRSPRTDTPCSR